MYRVQDLYNKHGASLGLELVAGRNGLKKAVRLSEAHRPGLALSGFLKGFVKQRFLVFGNVEQAYLKDLEGQARKERLESLLTASTPAVVVAGKYRPLPELINLCEGLRIPLFRSQKKTTELLSRLTLILLEEFSPTLSLHGTLVEVFGVGVVIQGYSSIGKSEAALSLIERGHRLISDDVVRIRVREGSYLEGSGPELTRHLLEIRGIGIINVAHLYGAVCVREAKRVDLIVNLEEWDEARFYDRIGLDEACVDFLEISVPFYALPVKPGRDVALLIETITLNHRLKEMGYHSAKEFSAKLLETISRKSSRPLPTGREGETEIRNLLKGEQE